VSGAEAYSHAKFHLDPSNRLATVHQRYRQGRSQKFAWGINLYCTILQSYILTSSAAISHISAQNNFQGLILGRYIYQYTPVAVNYRQVDRTARQRIDSIRRIVLQNGRPIIIMGIFKTSIIIISALKRLNFTVGRLTSLSVYGLLFGQPFVKRFALCYRTVVCVL